MTDKTVTRPLVRSPLAATHAGLGAEVGIEDGAEFVRSYGDPDMERAAVTDAVGVADVTVRAKIDVRGDVDRAMVPLPTDVVARIADDWAVLLSPPGDVADRVASMQTAAGATAMVTDVTHLFSGFALAGPLLDGAIRRLSGWDPGTLPTGKATGAPIAGIRALVVRRETSVPVLEVYPAMEFARYAWGAMLDVVGALGGAAVGWDALHAEGWR